MNALTTAYTTIEVIGDNALTFLQGQLTCDVLNLPKGQVQRGALCNLQGRVLSLVDLCVWQQKVYLLVSSDLLNITLKTLKQPALFSRVKLQLTETIIPAFSLALQDAKAFHKQELEQHRVLIHANTSGLYLPHTLNLHLSNIISFNKGCYRGQEIIARMHYRGKLKYELKFITLSSIDELKPGDKISEGEIVDCSEIDIHQYLVAISVLKT
jgi:folate-binding protein YgfZ